MYEQSFNLLPKVEEDKQIHVDRYFIFIELRQYRILPKEEYTEKHHIWPVAFGASRSYSKESWNIIELTAREHYIAHLLLWKAFGGKMANAFCVLANKTRECAGLTSRQYEQLKLEVSEYIRNNNPMNSPVICEETKEWYISMREAARKNNTFVGSIIGSCQKGYEVNGRHYIYENEQLKNFYEKNRYSKRKKRVYIVETKEIFSSVREAIKKYPIDPSCISLACINETFTAAGYHWRFLDKDGNIIKPKNTKEDISERKKDNALKRSKLFMKKVKCKETNIEYESLVDAQKQTGINSQLISKNCKGIIEHAGNLHWEYL